MPFRSSFRTVSERSAPTYRKFGIVRHTFPLMTVLEKIFLTFGVFCLLILAFISNHKPMTGAESQVAYTCVGIGGSVFSYWLRQEPAACLELLLFPFWGLKIKWPRVVLIGISFYGGTCFFGCLFGAPLVAFPAWSKSQFAELLVFQFAVVMCVICLRKRRGVKEHAA